MNYGVIVSFLHRFTILTLSFYKVRTTTHIQTFQLSQLTARIGETLSDAFGSAAYWVIADVSNHTFQPGYSRHFLDLVEKDEASKTVIAKVSAVAWSTGTARIQVFEKTTGQKFKSGIKVCLKVQVDFHPSYGLKLVIVDVDPSFTIGQLELHRQATINRLLTECPSHIQKVGDGFKTVNNSASHATVIQRIAVISSSSSAGYADFMDALYRNKYGYRFHVNNYFTSVQGEANADAAAKKIEEICASGIKFDTVVIIRGGGADTDFLIFDQYNLCSAVAKLHIPVITGIGHLKNQSIVDMLAHTPTNAPTKAAEFIVAHNLAFETLLLNEQKKVVIRSQQLLSRHSQSMQVLNQTITRKARAVLTLRKEEGEKLKQRIVASSKTVLFRQKLLLSETAGKVTSKPLRCINSKRNELRTATEDLKRGVKNYYLHQVTSIEKYETVCRLMSPVNLLKKGFAMVYHNGQIIIEGKQLQAGDEINVRLQDSDITSTITDKTPNDGDPLNL